ncbi:MAG: RNA methyltransferase tRNA(m5U54)methyltransferase [Thelocarpon superellum]|nr:MAG: RNA methyltransferase tRNA(m5U54)methyltransferase [Thelocarpon superellum]
MSVDETAVSTSATAAQPSSIEDTPQAGQRVTHGGKEYHTVQEGAAFILIPKDSNSATEDEAAQSVFYNPIQRFNRDLTVLAIKAYGQALLASQREKTQNGTAKKGRQSKKRKWAERNAAAEAVDVKPIAMEVEPSGGKGLNEPPPTNAPGVVGAASDEGKSSKAAGPITRPFRILDALSATGLRALRYAKELPFATCIVANDLSVDATKAIKLNIKLNRVGDRVHVSTGNAMAQMYATLTPTTSRDSATGGGKYDVIDLDPYGTAAPFFEAAVQAVKDGGLLCATCTDPGVFASVGYPEKTYALYGGTPAKGPHSHEAGLRLILHAIASTAARHGLAIEPLLCLSIDYYARVFVRVRRSPAAVKFLAGKTMVVYSCDQGCGAWATQLLLRNRATKAKNGEAIYRHGLAHGPSAGQRCEHCGFSTHIAGPMYAGPLHSTPFIQSMLDDLPRVDDGVYGTIARIEGMLLTALEEDLSHATPLEPTGEDEIASRTQYDPAALDHHPFFFIPHALAKVIHSQTPHENALRGALKHLGYRVSRSHCKAGSIKTDAPWSVIWEVMREWARQKAPIRDGAVKPGTAGWAIMKKDPLPEGLTSSSVMARDAPLGSASGPKPAVTDDESPSASVPAADDLSDGTGRQVQFDEVLGRQKDRKRVVRYQLNPTPNWGPMNRAKSS